MAVTAAGSSAIVDAAAKRDVTATRTAADSCHGNPDDTGHGRLVAQASRSGQFRPGLFDYSNGELALCGLRLMRGATRVSCQSHEKNDQSVANLWSILSDFDNTALECWFGASSDAGHASKQPSAFIIARKQATQQQTKVSRSNPTVVQRPLVFTKCTCFPELKGLFRMTTSQPEEFEFEKKSPNFLLQIESVLSTFHFMF